MKIDSAAFARYFVEIAARIGASKDYITELDSATGDGDHWANMDLGFRKLSALSAELAAMPLSALFKKVGMTIMSGVGGSSGVLYGSAYIRAAQTVTDCESLDLHGLARVLRAQLAAIMERGNAKPGDKTMIDALAPAVDALEKALAASAGDDAALEAMARAAVEGAEATRGMEAVKGRATYQTGKGVGHLDPGAVTMSYQLETMASCFRG